MLRVAIVALKSGANKYPDNRSDRRLLGQGIAVYPEERSEDVADAPAGMAYEPEPGLEVYPEERSVDAGIARPHCWAGFRAGQWG